MKFDKLFLALFLVLVFVPFHTSSAQQSVTPGCYDSGGLSQKPMYPVPPVGQNCPPGTYLVGSNGYDSGNSVDNKLSYTPLEPLPGQSPKAPANFCDSLNLFFKVFIYLGGMLAVVFLVLGGITYMVSEVVDKRSAARGRIQAAIVGLLILLGAYIILFTVNPKLVTVCSMLSPSGPGFVSQTPGSTSINAPTIAELTKACKAASPDNLASVIPAGGSVPVGCRIVPSCDSLWRAVGSCCDVVRDPTSNSEGLTCGRAIR